MHFNLKKNLMILQFALIIFLTYYLINSVIYQCIYFIAFSMIGIALLIPYSIFKKDNLVEIETSSDLDLRKILKAIFYSFRVLFLLVLILQFINYNPFKPQKTLSAAKSYSSLPLEISMKKRSYREKISVDGFTDKIADQITEFWTNIE